ncbi:hypothetical protein ACFQ3L_06360 [Lacticaseibacillus jixianensis]|uniref:Uncharacterized protein n=1 Tax=Lacticaseibacillus jixianensis TaxID=2486012 RepID=A0ABW4BAG5_9LACO|nr:hypothetical protein [Lacticaseibacillus jixianensis]
MDEQVKNELQALRKAVLQATPKTAAAQANALLTLGFRKLEQGDFTKDYLEFSFWPQLAKFLPEAVQGNLKAGFAKLEQ